MTRPDDDYLWDRSGAPDPDVARLEGLLAPLRHAAPLDELRVRRRRSRVPWFVAGAVIAAAAALVMVWQWPRGHGGSPVTHACGAQARGFAFTGHGGSVRCGGERVAAGVLPVGGVLDTGAHEAELAIADIGSARLSPQTRIRLERTSAERHQLVLERGRLHAVVSAPPRMFAVSTPSTQVIDLGCEYTLEVDDHGAGSILVQSGMVELEAEPGRIVVVPAGARARLLAGRRASLPLAAGASETLSSAIRAYETDPGDGIAAILTAATPADAITVANLVRLVPDHERRRVLDRLAELSPAPQDMSVDDIEELDLFEMWFDEVVYAQVSRP